MSPLAKKLLIAIVVLVLLYFGLTYFGVIGGDTPPEGDTADEVG